MGEAKRRAEAAAGQPWRCIFMGGELAGAKASVLEAAAELKVDLFKATKDPRQQGREALYKRQGEACDRCRVVVYQHDSTYARVILAGERDMPPAPSMAELAGVSRRAKTAGA